MMTSEFKAGDFVKLKGGGPMMMIKEVVAPEGNILCVWFAGPERCGSSFRPEDLVHL